MEHFRLGIDLNATKAFELSDNKSRSLKAWAIPRLVQKKSREDYFESGKKGK